MDRGPAVDADTGWWQRWLLPARPGLRPFALSLMALLLPMPAVYAGSEWLIPALAAGVTLGLGLGLGWALTVGAAWLRAAPASAIGIFLVAFACLAHVQLMPSWNLVRRAETTRDDFRAWVADPRPATVDEPDYDCGPYRSQLQVVAAPGGDVLAYTPEPFQRWSPFGWRPAWFLLLRSHGGRVTIETFASAEAMVRALPPESGHPDPVSGL